MATQEQIVEEYTKKYNVNKLGYYEVFEGINSAISRENCLRALTEKQNLN